MSKHVFEFDFTRFGCNEDAVKDLVQQMLDHVSRTTEPDERPATFFVVRNPQPKGVYVEPGDRVTNNGASRIVAPKGTNAFDNAPNRMSLWYGMRDDQHCWTNTDTLATLDGQPVLGYWHDKEDEK